MEIMAGILLLLGTAVGLPPQSGQADSLYAVVRREDVEQPAPIRKELFRTEWAMHIEEVAEGRVQRGNIRTPRYALDSGTSLKTAVLPAQRSPKIVPGHTSG